MRRDIRYLVGISVLLAALVVLLWPGALPLLMIGALGLALAVLAIASLLLLRSRRGGRR
jgi:hypothetical protein